MRDADVEFDVVEYLKNPPSAGDLRRFLELIDRQPADLVRKDKHFKELGLDAGQYTTPDEVIALLLEHPRLMQRPVVVRGERALIARPSAKVQELL